MKDDARNRYVVYLECSSSYGRFDFELYCDFLISPQDFSDSHYRDNCEAHNTMNSRGYNNFGYYLNDDDLSKVNQFFIEKVHVGNVRYGDSYSAEQAGIVGPNANVANFNIENIKNHYEIDLGALQHELSKLRTAMWVNCEKPENYTAIGAVAAAETAARKGNGNKVMEHLKKAGTWAWDVATKIGTSVAAEAIKKSKAYNEKAKCYFEMGHFLESLRWYLASLADMLLMSKGGNENDRKLLYNNIQEVKRFLDFEEDQPILDKNEIRWFFDNDFRYNDEINKSAITPDRFEELIDIEYRHIAADVLVRIGFVLWTLRVHYWTSGNNTAKKNEDNDAAKHAEAFIKPVWYDFRTSFGDYQMLLNDDNSNELGTIVRFRELERIFAALMLMGLRDAGTGLSESDPKWPFIELGKQSMKNIDNIITLPKMLYSYLMRDGYRFRSAEFRVEDGCAEEKPQTQAKRGGNNARLNKFVVLRRWQSYNPKIPRPRYKNVPGGGYFLYWEGKGIVIDPGYSFIQNFYSEGFSIEDIDAIVVTHSHPDHDDELSTILTLLFEWNEYQEKIHGENQENNRKKTIDLFLNEGSYRKYSSWLYAPHSLVEKIYMLQNNRWNKSTEKLKAENSSAEKWGENVRLCLRESYHLDLEVVPAWHNEIIASHLSVGLKFHLYKDKTPPTIIGLTGDTANYYTGVREDYKECDILVAHLGDIKIDEIISGANIVLTSSSALMDKLIHAQEKKEFIGMMGLLNPKADISAQLDAIRSSYCNNGLISNRVTIFEGILEQMAKSFKYSHLGLGGLIGLYKAMNTSTKSSHSRLFVIGEFPEELGSYKQMVARVLNSLRGESNCHCITRSQAHS